MKSSLAVRSQSPSIWQPADFGDKAADIITGFVGSWVFVGIHAFWFIIWIVLRIELFRLGSSPYL